MKVITMTLFSSLLYASSRHSKFVDGFTTSLRNHHLRMPYAFKHTLHTFKMSQEQISFTKQPPLKINLLTIHEEELQTLLESWKQPKYRAKQIIDWVKEKGVSDFDDMNNLPKSLRNLLKANTTIGTLKLDVEMVSKDGTRKRAYRLHDGQLIESVLMPYEDGRNTACISSQAGCAMACSFCATGQMGFARQLSPDEIYEQVARFSSELRAENKRLSNVVMMGMGEPLANYRNVIEAIKRMNTELGIGARKITVSTVGIVPNIKKLIEEDIQVRLAVSLHSASEEERSALLPANKRYGGLDTLMETVKEYIDRTNRRVTFEWALIENENDTPETATKLGTLIQRHGIRRDMIHINLIPLNPTGGYGGSPSARQSVNAFVDILDKKFGIKATPRVRRGIDIEAGCGQLKAAVKKKEEGELLEKSKDILNVKENLVEIESKTFADEILLPSTVGVYEDTDDEDSTMETLYANRVKESNRLKQGAIVDFELFETVDLDEDEDFVDEQYQHDLDIKEAERLTNLVKSLFPSPSKKATESENDTFTLVGPTTNILDEDNLVQSKKRRKKLLKNLKSIKKLKELQSNGKKLNTEQIEKIAKENEWLLELESVEHNLQ